MFFKNIEGKHFRLCDLENESLKFERKRFSWEEYLYDDQYSRRTQKGELHFVSKVIQRKMCRNMEKCNVWYFWHFWKRDR